MDEITGHVLLDTNFYTQHVNILYIFRINKTFKTNSNSNGCTGTKKKKKVNKKQIKTASRDICFQRKLRWVLIWSKT